MPQYAFRCAECHKSIGEQLWNPDKFEDKFLSEGDVVKMPDKKCECGSIRFEKTQNRGPCANTPVMWMP